MPSETEWDMHVVHFSCGRGRFIGFCKNDDKLLVCQVIAVAKSSDLVLMVLDASKVSPSCINCSLDSSIFFYEIF